MLSEYEELTVLLVDDEPKVIKGLERSLSLLETDWNILVAFSGEEGLRLLEEESVDVVLSDLRMPVMDGAAFLKTVRSRHPGVIRFVLSGYADKHLMLEAERYAHQYLVKPCTAQKVVESVKKVYETYSRINNKEVLDVVSNSEGLLSGDGLVGELLRVTDDPECSIDSLKELIIKDPPIYASILKISNTAFFGSSGEIESIDQALMILGIDFVKAIGLVELMKREITLSPSQSHFAERVFEHSIEARQLVVHFAGAIGNPKFVQRIQSIALLHDLGKLILLDYAGDRYMKMCADSLEQDKECWRLEREIFGCDHAAIGAYLFELWGFPEEIVRGVAWHHCPEDLGNDDNCSSWYMYIVNLLSHRLNGSASYRSGIVTDDELKKYSLPESVIGDL